MLDSFKRHTDRQLTCSKPCAMRNCFLLISHCVKSATRSSPPTILVLLAESGSKGAFRSHASGAQLEGYLVPIKTRDGVPTLPFDQLARNS
jgi:hypothetical protein